MRFVRGQGLSIADARGLRLDVRDGALRVHRSDRDIEVVGTVGSLTSAVWLDAELTRKLVERRYYFLLPFAFLRPLVRWRMRRSLGGLADMVDEFRGGAVVISGPDGVAVTVFVDTFALSSSDPAEKREESGAVDLVRSLGLVLEAGRGTDLPSRREVREALVDPQREEERVGRLALFLTILAGVISFLSMPFSASWAGFGLGVAALFVIAPVLRLLIVHRKRFEHLVNVPAEPGGRTVYRPPSDAVGDLNTHIQFGERDVVVVNGVGGELWLPGPSVGGVTSCVLGDGTIALLDRRSKAVHVLPSSCLAPDDRSWARLADAAGAAGIGATVDTFAHHQTSLVEPLDTLDDPGGWMSDWERGRIASLVDVLLPFAAGVHLLGAVVVWGELGDVVGRDENLQWLGVIPVCGSLVWFGIRAWAGLRYRSWRRSVRQRLPEPRGA